MAAILSPGITLDSTFSFDIRIAYKTRCAVVRVESFPQWVKTTSSSSSFVSTSSKVYSSQTLFPFTIQDISCGLCYVIRSCLYNILPFGSDILAYAFHARIKYSYFTLSLYRLFLISIFAIIFLNPINWHIFGDSYHPADTFPLYNTSLKYPLSNNES